MTGGFYYRNGKKLPSIRIKRPGLYGKDFMSKPRSVRFAKIRQMEKKEGPKLVHEQMAAMRAFTYRDPNARIRRDGLQDLKYSEEISGGK